MTVSAEDLVVGVEYQVEWSDCCVAGAFRAKLIEIDWDQTEPDYINGLYFSNGVALTESLFGYQFTAV